MKNNNKIIIIFLVIFIILTCVLSGYIVYDKLIPKTLKNDQQITNEESDKDENNNSEDSTSNNENESSSNDSTNVENDITSNENQENLQKYTYEDIEEGRYQSSEAPGAYLTLWANKIYSYQSSNGQSYFGTYTINDDKIILVVLEGYNKNKEHVVPTTEITITLNIKSAVEFLDTTNNVVLTRVNQPSREGGSPKENFD